MTRRLPRVPDAKVALASASVYPESTANAFEIAARLGYDGVEVMVWTDPVSQDVDALQRLSDYHQVPILAIHAPCLVITQRVWGTDPWVKLVKAKEAAEELGAETVVVHPPFRWQRDYVRQFVGGIQQMASETEVRDFTLDLSHTSVSQSDALDMRKAMGDRLSHVHIADGSGTARDEHLVPGRGEQPCGELLEGLADRNYDGLVVVEVNTRKCDDRAEREADLAEALAFTRLHLAAPSLMTADD